ncbi:heavy metal-binding protein HIP-like [Mytilus trossulus]|uniref:heavy metal-binding protein HIP-like n=1 Tax=Mytilus trossulus TaxID=6551 RepID=UPI003006DB4D
MKVFLVNIKMGSIYLLLFIGICGQFGKVLSNENDKKICVSEDFMRKMMKGCCKNSEPAHKERPVFFASLKTHPFTLNGINDVVKFDDVRINRGDGYNPSTGVFTAPKSGLYQISCMILGEVSNIVQFSLIKNDTVYIYGHVNKGYDSQTINSIIDLTKRDRVYIKHRANGVQKICGNHHSTFSGNFLPE